MGKKGKYNRRDQEQEFVQKKKVITQEQLMDKSHMQRINFIPLLPQDSLYGPFFFKDLNESALRKIVSDLNYLLYTDFKHFWATMLYNPSLRCCLSASLEFLHRRWLNNTTYSNITQSESQEMIDGLEADAYNNIKYTKMYDYTKGLTQVILTIYYRVVNCNKQDKELSSLYKIQEQISKKFILDVPKLFELIDIYGDSNQALVKYIVKNYAQTVPHFYRLMADQIFPILIKKVEGTLRSLKILTQREEFGINYSYNVEYGKQLSPAEQQFKRKINLLLEIKSFQKIVKDFIKFFPSNCSQYCYFNQIIHLIQQNIFLELEAAYKIWNYQGQERQVLNLINYIMKDSITYFVEYFEKVNNILVLRKTSSNVKEAYLNSLQRIFKEYGKRFTMPKKNMKRSLLMYKIIQKNFDLNQMLEIIYIDETDNETYEMNVEFLVDFKVALQSQMQLGKKVQQEVLQSQKLKQQLQKQNQNDNNQQEMDDQNESGQQIIDLQQFKFEEPKGDDFDNLDFLVSKRLRSEDYYTKLYQGHKFPIKTDYDDDYDEMVDYDRRPHFIDEQSSDSQSQKDKRRVSNYENLKKTKQIHMHHQMNHEQLRKKKVNEPKYFRVAGSALNQKETKKYVEKEGGQDKKDKNKYVQKQKQEMKGEKYNSSDDNEKPKKKYQNKTNNNKKNYEKGGNTNKNKQYRQKN